MDNCVMNQVQQTYLDTSQKTLRADFDRDAFDRLITEKGLRVTVETAILCPCKGIEGNAKSNCKNCGATGWVFINPRESRMVLQGMDAAVKYMGWSEELRGMVRISCLSTEQLTFMDKITALDGEAIHQEVLFFKTHPTENRLFAYTAYPVKKFLYIAAFNGVTNIFNRLTEGVDYDVSNQAVILKETYNNPNISVTVRYKYAPTFHVLEMKRETMPHLRLIDAPKEELQMMPLSAYGRRAHYILNAPNLAGDRLLDNSYDLPCEPEAPVCL